MDSLGRRLCRSPCNVIDLPDTGVQITIDPADFVPTFFTFMISRDNRIGSARQSKMATWIEDRRRISIDTQASPENGMIGKQRPWNRAISRTSV
jgi:hypothetical protein